MFIAHKNRSFGAPSGVRYLLIRSARSIVITVDHIALLLECGTSRSSIIYKHCTPDGVEPLGQLRDFIWSRFCCDVSLAHRDSTERSPLPKLWESITHQIQSQPMLQPGFRAGEYKCESFRRLKGLFQDLIAVASEAPVRDADKRCVVR